MSAAIRQSPVHEALAHRSPEWGEINSMPVALSFRSEESELFKRLALCDLSALERFGVAGPNAADWLREQGCEVPEGINTWTGLQNGGLVARLGSSEFLIEDAPEGSTARGLKDSLNSGADGVRPVVRQDAAFALIGERAREVMLEVCGLDFDSVDHDERPVFMTRVAVISAVVLPQTLGGTPVFRIWCDYPYGMYLWEELCGIVEELGGKPVGVSAFFGGEEGAES
jgi:sarcosine oxidase subunit gamma